MHVPFEAFINKTSGKCNIPYGDGTHSLLLNPNTSQGFQSTHHYLFFSLTLCTLKEERFLRTESNSEKQTTIQNHGSGKGGQAGGTFQAEGVELGRYVVLEHRCGHLRYLPQ